MDMSKFWVDDYFTTYEPKARYMMGSSDPESLRLQEVIKDWSPYREKSLDSYLRIGLCRESFPVCVRLVHVYLTR